jgi:hypothetical protein
MDILEGGIKTIIGTKPDLIISQFPLFLCFLSTRLELMTSTQKEMLRYITSKWKLALVSLYKHCIVFSGKLAVATDHVMLINLHSMTC